MKEGKKSAYLKEAGGTVACPSHSDGILGGIKMKKIMEQQKSQGELCGIYCDADFGKFLAGRIEAVDDGWFLLSSVTPAGEPDGYVCRQIETVCRMNTDTVYLKNLQKLMREAGTEPMPSPIPLLEGGIFPSTLQYLLETKKICTIEILDDRDLALTGVIREWRDDCLLIDTLDAQGREDGLSVLKTEDISCVSFDAEEERQLKIISGK